MGKTWYHNISKRKFNIHDTIDLIDEYEDGELIMKSVDGCAIIEDVSNEELQSLISNWKEHDY